MFGAAKLWFMALSTIGKAGVVTGAVLVSGAASAAISPQPSQISPPNTNPPAAAAPQKVVCNPNVTSQVEKEAIPFQKVTVQDPATAQGKTYLKTAGGMGEKEITYAVTTYTPAGCNTNTKVLQTESITRATVDEVTANGTYVYTPPPAPSCPNGSYINSDGLKVCSPGSDSNGASAKCADGTFSYSLHRSGTCSHHGGVSVWY